MYHFWISTNPLGSRYRIVASDIEAAKRIAKGLYGHVTNRPPVLVFNGIGEHVATV